MKPLSVPQAAERLGLSIAMVRRYCQNGDLLATKFTGAWAIKEDDLEKFASKPRRRGPKIKTDDLLEIAIQQIALGSAVDPKW